MAHPFFYISQYNHEKQLMLEEDTSRHVVQVLRMKAGERLNLTDGKGNLLTCEIREANKKHCTVDVIEKTYKEQHEKRISIAISLLKNVNRFEWFLEKATEIGVSEIIPLLCERTEKEKFRYERLNGICISAMLQSQQCWLPLLKQPQPFKKVLEQSTAIAKYIAHCEDGPKNPLAKQASQSTSIILIGPEGDFTPGEIERALEQGFVPVSLGEKRLRTETAGVVATVLLVNA